MCRRQGLLGDYPEEKARGEQDKPIDIAAIMSHSLSELLNTSAEILTPHKVPTLQRRKLSHRVE